jgi:hypothetical protein
VLDRLYIEVPDALLLELEQLQVQLLILLSQWAIVAKGAKLPGGLPGSAHQEVLRFLVSQPAPIDILQFKVSETAQVGLRELLERNKNGSLSEEEIAELDSYEQLDQLMQMLKVQAYSAIQQDGQAA